MKTPTMSQVVSVVAYSCRLLLSLDLGVRSVIRIVEQLSCTLEPFRKHLPSVQTVQAEVLYDAVDSKHINGFRFDQAVTARRSVCVRLIPLNERMLNENTECSIKVWLASVFRRFHLNALKASAP